MWNEPTAEELGRLPSLYATEDVPWDEKVVYEHFFLGGCDWFACEYCPQRRILFAFVILNGDLDNAEWGYVDLEALRALSVRGIEVDRDLWWTPRCAREVDAIRAACGAPPAPAPPGLALSPPNAPAAPFPHAPRQPRSPP